MKRAPFVVGATGVGLGLVLSYHTKPIHSTVVAAGGASASTAPTTSHSTEAPTTTVPSTAPSSLGTTPTSSAATRPTTAPTAAPTTLGTRSATGNDVTYRYGDIQLEVTEQGRRITNIQVVAESATDPRSEEINSQAIPQLQQEAMSAQSANIDGVSGATYTSQAYAQSLQSALDQLN